MADYKILNNDPQEPKKTNPIKGFLITVLALCVVVILVYIFFKLLWILIVGVAVVFLISLITRLRR